MTHINRNKFFPDCLYHSFNEPFFVEKASNVHYYSPNDSSPYLDMYNNVTHIGHSNPKVLEAVIRGYSTINIHTRYYQENLINYANHLFQYLPKDTYKILFTNSGSESNDLALQISMNAVDMNSDKIIGAFKGSYHGTTYLCKKVSYLTPTGSYKDENDNFVNFFSPSSKTILNELDNLDKLDIFITESIQGVAGNIDISDELLQKIREKSNIMICDEVQTGFGRTGDTFWAFEKANIIPDIITCGKPIANGYPMGACIFRKELEEYLPEKYFNTFGGNSVACLVAKTVLEEIEEKQLMKNAKELGDFLKIELEALGYKVTGRGLFLGIHISNTSDCCKMVEEFKNNRIIVGMSKNIIRIKPPITITKSDIELFIENLKNIKSLNCVKYLNKKILL